jgi:hypothetical protein
VTASGRESRSKLGAERLVAVWNAPDEASATLVCAFLKEQGIEASVMPVQIPWLGGVETLHHGYWGKVEVLSGEAARAAQLIEEFFRARPEPPSGAGDEGPDA